MIKTKWNNKLINDIENMKIGDVINLEAKNENGSINVVIFECIEFVGKKHIAVSYDYGNADLYNVEDLYRENEILGRVLSFYEEEGRDITVESINNSDWLTH
jgi:hypothetical protein